MSLLVLIKREDSGKELGWTILRAGLLSSSWLLPQDLQKVHHKYLEIEDEAKLQILPV